MMDRIDDLRSATLLINDFTDFRVQRIQRDKPDLFSDEDDTVRDTRQAVSLKMMQRFLKSQVAILSLKEKICEEIRGMNPKEIPSSLLKELNRTAIRGRFHHRADGSGI